MKYCPKCREYRDVLDASFCKICGTKLEEVQQDHTDNSDEELIVCPECQTKNRCKNKYCSVCGYGFSEVEPITASTEESKKGNKGILILIVLIVILLCVLGFIGYKVIDVLFPNALKKQQNETASDTSITATVSPTELADEPVSETASTQSNKTNTESSDLETSSATSEFNFESTVDNNQSTSTGTVSYQIGDYIYFGAFDQDNNPANGNESIEWLIIDKSDDCLFVISRYGLDCVPYNTVSEETSWTECSLRYWLNNTFLNAAFSAEEKQEITVINSPLSDKIFVLSVTEASHYFTNPSSRMTSATNTAIANGSYQENGVCGWWLRDMGDTNRIAARVNKEGEIVTYDSTEGGVERKDYSVRPAMWIKIY